MQSSEGTRSMDTKIEEAGLKYLEKIEEDVEDIKRRAPGSRRAFLNGIMQGVGAVVGSIIAVFLLGWLLSFLGFIPGLQEFAESVRNISPAVK